MVAVFGKSYVNSFGMKFKLFLECFFGISGISGTGGTEMEEVFEIGPIVDAAICTLSIKSL